MTKKEMTELFSVMMLAWPNAEMFKGGIQKLGPTIELWTVCLADVDFWTAQQAVIKLCQECKFPPSIAEFKEKSETVASALKYRVDIEWDKVRWDLKSGRSAEEVFSELPDSSFAKQAIAAMGGPSALIVQGMHIYGDGRTEPCEYYNYDGFKKALNQIIRSRPALGENRRPALSDAEGRRK